MEEMRPSKDTAYRHVLETIPGIGPVLAASIMEKLAILTAFLMLRLLWLMLV